MLKLIGIGILLLVGVFFLVACSGEDKTPNQALAKSIDLQRFMGTWYVHGYTPTPFDKKAYAATETYELSDDGKIQTTYRFRKGGPEGSWKTMTPKGWVHDTQSNAEWRMRFFGLFTSPYYILYVSDDYTETVVGHSDKDLAWIMTRSPVISEERYLKLRAELEERDYKLEDLARIEHPVD